MSAFDDALHGAGVHDFNLVRLSSVIPPQASLHRSTERLPGGHGDRLYCVYASAYAELPGETVWAGIGWVRDTTGRGLFVEHTAGSEESLVELLRLSLEDMNERRGGGYGDIDYVTVSAHHDEQPACALAIATYQTVRWELA